MVTLISPNGDRYVTDDPREINNLTLGHGYRVADNEPGPEQPEQPEQSPGEPT